MSTRPNRRRLVVGEHSGAAGANRENTNTTANDAASFPYTTVGLLWAIHVIYYFQWFRRRRRTSRNHYQRHQHHRPKASYNRLLEQKKFYLVWWTTLSVLLPPPRQSQLDATDSEEQGRSTQPVAPPSQQEPLSVPMGNDGLRAEDAALERRAAELQNMSFRERIRQAVVSHRLIGPFLQRLTLNGRYQQVMGRIWSSIDQTVLQPCGGLSMVCRLVYHTHLLWSCRALEGIAGSAWAYLCTLTTLVFGGLAVELYLEHSFVTNYASSSTSSNGYYFHNTTADDDDSMVRRFLRKEVRQRRLIALSLSSLTATVVMLFRQEFPYVSIPVLPFLPGYHGGPVLSHFLCLLLLGLVSSRHHRHVYVEIWWGCGLGWCGGALITPSSHASYWGSPIVLLGLVLLPLVSLWVQEQKSSFGTPWWLRWIQNVGWNRRGKLLVVDDTTDEWMEQELWVGTADDVDDDTSDHSRRSETDEEEPVDEHDAVSHEFDAATTELTPLVGDGPSNMRSRRNAS